jgi:putative transposase
MKRRRHRPDQIIGKLAEGKKLLGQGQSIEEPARYLEITESTWHRWNNQYHSGLFPRYRSMDGAAHMPR